MHARTRVRGKSSPCKHRTSYCVYGDAESVPVSDARTRSDPKVSFMFYSDPKMSTPSPWTPPMCSLVPNSLPLARARVLPLSLLYLMSTELRICMSEQYRKMSLESALMVKCSTAFQQEQPVGRRELTCVTRDNAAVLTCFARTLVMAITCCWWRGASNVPMRLARSWGKF